MKKLAITTVGLSLALLTSVVAKPKGGGKGGLRGGGHGRIDNRAEKVAEREEMFLDKIDANALLKDLECGDHRKANLIEYTNHTSKRIVKLAVRGALTDDQANGFKDRHQEIVKAAKEAKAKTGSVDASAVRNGLNALNDDINKAVVAAEKGDKRTPFLNHAQLRYEEQIQFGEKTGRLSKGEASSLRRKVSSLSKLEERLKNGEKLSSSEREKLTKESLEVRRELQKELRD